MSENEPQGESITAEGIVKLKAEVEELESSGREAIAARLRTARDLGDLKENAEYHIAKEDQAHLETRIKTLRHRLTKAVVVDVDASKTNTFTFGRTATIEDDKGGSHSWTLVGSTEANLSEGLLSAESPIGQAMRNASVGETVTVVTPKGKRNFKVTAVS